MQVFLVVIRTVLQETYCLVDINRKKIIIIQECLSLKQLNCPGDLPELGVLWQREENTRIRPFTRLAISIFSRFLSAIARKSAGVHL
jgi:hypothetical protein